MICLLLVLLFDGGGSLLFWMCWVGMVLLVWRVALDDVAVRCGCCGCLGVVCVC